MERGLEQLDLTIRGLQSLIAELRPAALDQLGVGPAVEALVERTAVTSGLEIEAHIELAHPRGRSGPRLDPELSTTVYRVVQEALTNAASRTESCL